MKTSLIGSFVVELHHCLTALKFTRTAYGATFKFFTKAEMLKLKASAHYVVYIS